MRPTLKRVSTEGVTFLTDVTLFDEEGIRVAFSQRGGGVSPSPYASLNVGAAVGDRPSHVATNRSRLARVVGVGEEGIGRINAALQVHGVKVATARPFKYEHPDTDALITDRREVPLLVCVADCVPIILVDRQTPALGVVHSGWRGTLDRITSRTVDRMHRELGSEPSRLLAYIGPHIGLQSFTITPDLYDRFSAEFDTIVPRDYAVNDGGDVSLDLGRIVEATLTQVGVPACNIANAHIDTVSRASDYFSYRAQDRVTGRFGALGCICSQSRS